MNKKLIWIYPERLNENTDLASYFEEDIKDLYKPYIINHGVGIKVECNDVSHNDFYTGEHYYKTKQAVPYKSYEDLGDMVWLEIVKQNLADMKEGLFKWKQ